MWKEFLDFIGWNKERVKPVYAEPHVKRNVITKADTTPTPKEEEVETCRCGSTDIHRNGMCYNCYIVWIVIISGG